VRGPPLRPLADAPVPWVALRAAVIYGFGRGLVDRIRTGTYRVIDDGTSHVSRIHVVDLVAAILAPASSPVTDAINVADDDPAPLGEVADAVAARLGLPPQPRVPTAAVPAEVTGMLTADRRIANRRLRDEFGVALRYPNWRDGLEADGGRGARSPASAPGRQAATTSANLAEFHEHGVDSSLGSRRTSGRRARLDRARNIAQTATGRCCQTRVL
jgi:hypothetical protein